ncbi:unnamed protein product [Ceratitis capitata]|uniref:(Mediterranean fruit fly) hypothetical protein n=1 Tax=Ceratitis capitata TaxID=7213 RepID=A0A811V338_CERCA|nr:unnamed protein product [Ceratitis capitata]
MKMAESEDEGDVGEVGAIPGNCRGAPVLCSTHADKHEGSIYLLLSQKFCKSEINKSKCREEGAAAAAEDEVQQEAKESSTSTVTHNVKQRYKQPKLRQQQEHEAMRLKDLRLSA